MRKYSPLQISFTDREKWVDDNLPQIRASVANPMAPDAWWKEGDDPWQLLATCIEYVHAIDSPNPTAYLSNIPIHQVVVAPRLHCRTVPATACSTTRRWVWMRRVARK